MRCTTARSCADHARTPARHVSRPMRVAVTRISKGSMRSSFALHGQRGGARSRKKTTARHLAPAVRRSRLFLGTRPNRARLRAVVTIRSTGRSRWLLPFSHHPNGLRQRSFKRWNARSVVTSATAWRAAASENKNKSFTERRTSSLRTPRTRTRVCRQSLTASRVRGTVVCRCLGVSLVPLPDRQRASRPQNRSGGMVVRAPPTGRSSRRCFW